VEIDGLIASQVLEPLAIRLEASHAVVCAATIRSAG
jgi:hypothetical protein